MKTNRAPRAAAQEAHAYEKAKDAWLRRIKRDRGLPRNAFSVADEIARGFNRNHFRETGELIAWPSIPTLAAGTGLSQRTVLRMNEAFAAAGYFAIETCRGRTHSNRYRATEPAAEKVSQLSRFRAAEKVTVPAVKGDSLGAEKVTDVSPDLLKGPSEPIGLSKQESPYRQGERETRIGARSSPPAAARAPDGDGAAGRREGSAAEERGYAELRRIWTRPWPDNDDAEARRAFTAAIAEGTDAEEIIAAAVEWVRCADAPRFLPKLSQWLTGRGWEKPPPQKRGARGQGRSGGGRKPKANLRNVALAYGAFVAQGGGMQ